MVCTLIKFAYPLTACLTFDTISKFRRRKAWQLLHLEQMSFLHFSPSQVGARLLLLRLILFASLHSVIHSFPYSAIYVLVPCQIETPEDGAMIIGTFELWFFFFLCHKVIDLCVFWNQMQVSNRKLVLAFLFLYPFQKSIQHQGTLYKQQFRQL